MAELVPIVPQATIAARVAFFAATLAPIKPAERRPQHIEQRSTIAGYAPNVTCTPWNIIEQNQGGHRWIAPIGVEAAVEIPSVNI